MVVITHSLNEGFVEKKNKKMNRDKKKKRLTSSALPHSHWINNTHQKQQMSGEGEWVTPRPISRSASAGAKKAVDVSKKEERVRIITSSTFIHRINLPTSTILIVEDGRKPGWEVSPPRLHVPRPRWENRN